MDKTKTKTFIDSTTNELNKMLTSMCNSDEKTCKKAELITYWLQDYKRYLEFEQVFTPKKLKNYERGDVLKVNLGFNIGNEEGGLHYAIVIDNNNDQSSGVITIVPLSSIKENDKESKFDVILGTELYDKLMNKYSNQREFCTNEISRLTGEVEKSRSKDKELRNIMASKEYNSIDQETLIKYKEKTEKLQNDISQLNIKIGCLKKIYKEINKMKLGTKALVGQVTTISKMRIFDPKSDNDILSGIKTSPDNLDLITEKIKELYVFNIDKSIRKEYNK